MLQERAASKAPVPVPEARQTEKTGSTAKAPKGVDKSSPLTPSGGFPGLVTATPTSNSGSASPMMAATRSRTGSKGSKAGEGDSRDVVRKLQAENRQLTLSLRDEIAKREALEEELKRTQDELAHLAQNVLYIYEQAATFMSQTQM